MDLLKALLALHSQADSETPAMEVAAADLEAVERVPLTGIYRNRGESTRQHPDALRAAHRDRFRLSAPLPRRTATGANRARARAHRP